MTERTIATIEAELATAFLERDRFIDLAIKLKNELDAAKLAAASHPWVGKKVQTQVMRGYGANKKFYTRRGTVALYDPKQHRRLRELSYWHLNPGDPIVVHEKGNTGWNLVTYDWSTKTHGNPWTLIEEPTK